MSYFRIFKSGSVEDVNSLIDNQARIWTSKTSHHTFHKNYQKCSQPERMSTAFANKKQKILQQLNAPPDEYTDASPKGSVDEPIREFVDEINQIDSLVTTSSCSGRFAIYLEGQRKGTTDEHESNDQPQVTSSGGKGGGQWLFVTHTALPDAPSTREMIAGQDNLPTIYSDEPFSAASRLVHFKFEPMILHILASSLDAAKRVLSAAQTTGFRESGISSISDKTDMVMVAVRTTGLSTDSQIGRLTVHDGKPAIALSVSDSHIQSLVRLANDKFVVNAERTTNFRSALLAQFCAQDNGDENWEPMEVRRARMREEGLKKQAERRGDEGVQKADEIDDGEDDVELAGFL